MYYTSVGKYCVYALAAQSESVVARIVALCLDPGGLQGAVGESVGPSSVEA